MQTVLSIQNIGRARIEIIDLMINERMDCSSVRVNGWSLEDQHKGFVYGTDYDSSFKTVLKTQPVILDIGDIHTWLMRCNPVRMTVVTDIGTQSFSFVTSSGQ